MASAELSAPRVVARRWEAPSIALASASIAIAVGCCAIALNNWLQRDWLEAVWLHKAPRGLEHLMLAALIAAVAATATTLAAIRGRARAVASAALRWIPTLALATWMLSWTIVAPAVRFDVQRALALAAAAWSALVAAGAGMPGRDWPRSLARVERVLALVAATVLATELGLRVVWSVSKPMLLATPGVDVAAFVRAHRSEPGSIHCASRVNSEGYVDEEPDRLGPNEPWIACVGDSFSVGVVPHHRHYTTLAEQALGVPIYNLGVVYAGPREYLHMLREHALPRSPRLVVVSIFIGNDVRDSQRQAPGWIERMTSPNEAIVLVAAKRVGAIRSGPRIDGVLAEAGLMAPAERDARLKWLDDPMLERPVFDERRFQYIEVGRARELLEGSPEMFEPMLEWLRRIREAAAPVPVGVLVLPDEFQVEDAVWEQVVEAGLPPDADRALPQRWLGERLSREGFEYVDVLPMLLEVPPLADGRRHVYHLRDTHFNARGNEVAARALVELVRRFELSR